MTQLSLGAALRIRGEQSAGAASTEPLTQAEQAIRAALEVFTKEALPLEWARTQNTLGITLQTEGEQSAGAASAELLGQSVQAYRAALEVFTKDNLPQDWAQTQCLAVNGVYRGSQSPDAAAYHPATETLRRTPPEAGQILEELGPVAFGRSSTPTPRQFSPRNRPALRCYRAPAVVTTF